MNIKILGLGAAGNKAAITAIEQGVVEKENVLLFNSTIRDIPENWKEISVQYTNTNRGGCGKERDSAKELCLEFLSSDRVKQLDSFIQDGEEALVVIAFSSEGGTGSGSAAIMAKYVTEVLGANVMCFMFTGFEEDGRGLQNTIECFQDMEDKYIIQAISNKKFLEGTTNKFKAEKAANEEFAKRLSIISGDRLVASEQNIDETDLYKVVTTNGFMTVGYAELNKIKNINQFNTAVVQSIDDDKSLDISTKSAKRIAVIINAKDETKDFIDYSYTIIKEKFGTPYEIFSHVQYDDEQPEYVSFIISGLDMPIDEVKEVYEKYKIESEKVSKKKDKFFDFASELKGNEEDSMFNVGRGKDVSTVDRTKFLNTFRKNIKETASHNKHENPTIKDVTNNQLKKY